LVGVNVEAIADVILLHLSSAAVGIWWTVDVILIHHQQQLESGGLLTY